MFAVASVVAFSAAASSAVALVFVAASESIKGVISTTKSKEKG